MHTVLMHLLVVCIGGIVIILDARTPADAYEVYYLSVGNSHYRDEGYWIHDANFSAREIAKYLRWAGALEGITLVSEPGAYVTRNDVLGALNEVTNRAKAATDPLVVYYLVGHGVSRQEGHVSLLGDYSPSDPGDVARSRAIIGTEELVALLEKQELPYILILDNCYYRAPKMKEVVLIPLGFNVVPLFPGLGEEVVEGVAPGVSRILRRLPLGISPLRTSGPWIELYAAKRGGYVQTLPYPWEPLNESYSIGPLARRLLLLFDAAFKSEQGLSVGRFLAQMQDPAFDPTSVVADHKVVIREAAMGKFTSPSPTSYEVDERLGGDLVRAGPQAKPAEAAGPPRRGSGGIDGR